MSRQRALAVATCALLLSTATGLDPLQTLHRENRRGNEALDSGDPSKALRHYTEAQGLAPDDPRVLYNLGLALAETGEVEKAERLWSRVAEGAEGTLRRDAWFNRGVLAMNQQDPAAAVEAFSEALLVDPRDAEAQENLELALRRLRAEPPQQQSSQPDDPPQDEGQDQKSQQPETGGGGQSEESRQDEQPAAAEERGDRQDRETSGERESQPSAGEQSGATPEDSSPAGQGELNDAQREMAERLLEQLEKGEQQALRRALSRMVEGQGRREDDGGRTW